MRAGLLTETTARNRRAAALASVAALFVLALVLTRSGGAFLFAAPLLVAVLVPEAVRSVLAIAAATTVATAALFALRGAPAIDVALHAAQAAVAGAFAVIGCLSVARVRRAERALETERLRAVEALERSERRCAEVELLAAAGSRGARLAHDLSNPLASMRANLEWLDGVGQAGRLHLEEAEVLDVVGETRACVERVAEQVREFRSAVEEAGVRPYGGTPRPPKPPGGGKSSE